MSTMPIQTSFSSTDNERIYGTQIRHYTFDGKEVAR